MADVITGDTQLGPTKEEVIGAIVQKELKFAAKLTPYFTDLSFLAAPGAKSVSYPKLESFTVVDRATGVAGDATTLAALTDKLDLDKNAYVSWIVDSSDEIQSKIAVQVEFARRAASAHGRYVDTQIIAGLETAGVATTTAAPLITRDVILEMLQALEEREADTSLLGLFIPPSQKIAMLKIAEFTQAQIYGGAVIPNGMIGSVYGVPVVVHNGLATAQYFMAEKNGLAYAFQKAPNMAEQPEIAYGTSAVRKAMDQLFGVKGLQIAVNGVGAGLSALIVKDNN